MTNGTSQGLFIVVAIVIFGIFVGLTYTVFGSEGLTNDLKVIFENATEQSTKRYNETNLINKETLKQHGGVIGSVHFTIDNKDKITLTSDGTNYVGVHIPDTVMEANKSYKMSFNIKTIEGLVTTLGGHMSYSDHTKLIIDGILISETNLKANGYLTNWYYGQPFKESEKEHNVEVIFNTNGWDDPLSPPSMQDSDFKSMYIQPNRGNFGESYTVEITNLTLIEQ